MMEIFTGMCEDFFSFNIFVYLFAILGLSCIMQDLLLWCKDSLHLVQRLSTWAPEHVGFSCCGAQAL